ncbi:unnamed protein product [Trichogramma brassicae]|uniref:Uncharacterized protein n=1 Tax=Trichogramma brassicae TaxID=86971 RepID=A0A6H5I8J9_9HYME|nr:unnamed protein product [Trichogramma brassicae]
MDQSRFNQLKSLQENIEWKVEEQRRAFLRRVVALIEDWEDDLPNLRHIFRPAEIELLLVDAVDCFCNDSRCPGRTFVDFVARSGYVDEPGKVECRRGVRPSLGRVTPLHRLFELHWDLSRDNWLSGRLDGLCFKLLKIYDRYDVDYVEEATGVTHFHVACCCLFASDHDQLRIIKRFLELGQKPNRVVRKTGYSPLHLALQRNNGEAVLLLLRAGARPNSATKEEKDTPLHIMSRKGVPGATVAETFFRACDESNRLVRIDVRNRCNRTPLVEALLYHNEEVAALLLRRGADPNSVDDEFLDTPLHICARDHLDESAGILFKICDEMNLPLRVNARDNEGKTPLELAIANLLPDTVDVLLDHGADLSKGLFSTAIDPKMIRRYLSVMRVASGVLVVAERLEAKGYDFSRNDALTIMKCFAELGLLEKSAVPRTRNIFPRVYIYIRMRVRMRDLCRGASYIRVRRLRTARDLISMRDAKREYIKPKRVAVRDQRKNYRAAPGFRSRRRLTAFNKWIELLMSPTLYKKISRSLQRGFIPTTIRKINQETTTPSLKAIKNREHELQRFSRNFLTFGAAVEAAAAAEATREAKVFGVNRQIVSAK